MALDSATYIKGEKSPIYVTETASVGTLTYTDVPTFTLYDATGTVVSGLGSLPCSGYTNGPQTTLQAYYDFNTNASGVGVGYYYALFLLPFSAQDGIARVRSYDFDIYIRESYAPAVVQGA